MAVTNQAVTVERHVPETYTQNQKLVDRILTAFAILVLFLLACLQLVPLYWMISTSIKFPEGIFSVPPQWIPSPISFHAYQRLWQYPYTGRWFLNTGIVAISVTVGSLVCNSMAGYAFAKMRFPGRNLFFWLVIATMTIPGQVILIPQYTMMAVELRWLNTYQALIIPALGSAFYIFLMRQFLSTLPTSLTDAGRMDACSEFGIYQKIVLPLAVPALAVLAIFGFIGHWNSFFWPLLMTKTPDMQMLQVGLTWLRFGSFDYGMLMAGATASAILPIVVFLALQKYFLTGLTLGAIKG